MPALELLPGDIAYLRVQAMIVPVVSRPVDQGVFGNR
jgi:hypothetical protein